MRRIALRVDADHAIGAGHAVRLGALLEMLDFPHSLVGLGSGAALPRLLPQVPIWHAATAGPPGGVASFDLVVVDLPRPDVRLLERARVSNVPVLAIDDFGGALDADLIVNGTGPPEQHHYAALRETAQALCGPSYALIRSCFRAVRDDRRPRPGRVTAVVGSGPGAERFAALLPQVCDLAPAVELDLVVGASFPRDAELAAAWDAAGMRVSRGLSGSELADRLAGSALALTTGGMVVTECLVLGVPVLAHAQVGSAARELAWLAEQGCVVDLGDCVEAESLARALISALADTDASRARAVRGIELFDGLGARRVAAAAASLAGVSPDSPRAGARIRSDRKESACAAR